MNVNSVRNRRGGNGAGPSFFAPALWTADTSSDQRLTDENRATLAAIATVVRFKRGETIYQEGEDASAIFNIITGTVKSYKTLSDGKKHIIGFAFPHGLIGLPETGKYVNGAEAATAVTLYRISAAAIEARLRRHAGLDFQVIGKLCHDLRDAQNHALMLSKHRAVEKLGLFLQMLEAQQSGLGVGGGDIFLPMSRSDIGSYAGISPEAVSRSLRELVSRGVIGFADRRHVQIIDRTLFEAAI